MRTKIRFVAIVLIAILTVSCSKNKEQQNFDYGKVENGKYLNSFFGMEIDVPSDWVVQSKEQTKKIMELGAKAIAGDNKNMKAIIKASEVNSANLLTLFRHELGTSVDYNENLFITVENIKKYPNIKTGEDYLTNARKLLKQAQVQYKHIDEKFQKRTIGNKNFYIMNASIDYMELPIQQIYYSSIQNGFCISLIISFINDEQKEALQEIIYSMNFNK